MSALISTLRPALVLLLLLTLLSGMAYPAAVTLLTQALFATQTHGSLIAADADKVYGSELIGQHFARPKYFWGRPSATTPTPYNAAASAGSNLSSANPALLAAVKTRLAALKAADPANKSPVPVDLVTASASGLDPHISVAAAHYQAARVARVRGMKEADIQALIERHTEGRQFGILGEPRVNVLKLNLALDEKL